jgi:o-succinylbenzoate synthase
VNGEAADAEELWMIDPICRVRLSHLRIPFKEPFRISTGEVATKDAILVQLETKAGMVGLGESSPMSAGFGYSSDTPDGCWVELSERIAKSLLGRSFEEQEEIASHSTTAWAGLSHFSIAGAETACWDLLAQARHEILAETLGATEVAIAQGVDCGLAVGLYPTVVELLRVVELHLSEGYKRLKIKIAPGRDLELVRAIRQHLGPIDLMVDANAAYTSNDLDVLRALDEFDLLMIEQPMAAADLAGSASLQAVLETPICLDETATTPERTIQAIEQGAGRIVNIKLQRVGGFGPALAIHEACRKHGVACWVGSMPELGVGQGHGLHLATLPNCRFPTDIEPSARWFVDDIIEPAIELAPGGKIRIPTRPGLGFLLNSAKLQRYEVQSQEFVS